MAFSFWARVLLGGNWSASVTLSHDRELVVDGPYRWVRRPIYTGLLVTSLEPRSLSANGAVSWPSRLRRSRSGANCSWKRLSCAGNSATPTPVTPDACRR
jgi:Isoprenylcysteine carboxyl methyltransferase (ICMT) family